MSEQLAHLESKKPCRSIIGDPYDSRIGGLPAFYAQDTSAEICSSCGKHLFLILQLYAPTDKDRTLYILGCNSPACNVFNGKTYSNGDWVVIRQQTMPDVEYSKSSAPAPAVTAPVNDWGASETWGGDGSWDTDAAVIAESAPLDTPSMPETTGSVPSIPACWEGVPCFPKAFALYVEDVDFSGGTASDSSDDDVSGKVSAAEDRHALRLLDEYKRSEASSAAAESTALPADEHSSDDDESDGEYEEKDPHPKALKREAKRTTSGPDKRKGKGSKRDIGGSTDDGEAYESVPPKFRYLLKFQNYLDKFRQPLVRYAYGREPLYPVPPSQRKVTVPRCSCGAERQFELQLFPAILEHLGVDDVIVSTAKSSDETSASIPKLELSGMEFLTVLIYSCVDSCDVSTREVAVVIHSSDG